MSTSREMKVLAERLKEKEKGPCKPPPKERSTFVVEQTENGYVVVGKAPYIAYDPPRYVFNGLAEVLEFLATEFKKTEGDNND